MRALAMLFTVSWAALPSPSRAAAWEIDPAHSQVSFSVKHLMVSTVRGEFGKFAGSVVCDEKEIKACKVDVTIDVSSVNTRQAQRDEHLRSPDFFDVAKYPLATFRSTRVDRAGAGHLRMTGDLTLKGVSKPVVLDMTGPTEPVHSPFGTTVVAASATTTINRRDFGVSWNKTLDSGGVMVSDEVGIVIEVELVKKEAPRAGP